MSDQEATEAIAVVSRAALEKYNIPKHELVHFINCRNSIAKAMYALMDLAGIGGDCSDERQVRVAAMAHLINETVIEANRQIEISKATAKTAATN